MLGAAANSAQPAAVTQAAMASARRGPQRSMARPAGACNSA
jgi:hypothetical protein